jgi:hypothetical protein
MTEIFTCNNPFPHLIANDLYSDEELTLIWQELEFLTHSWKLQSPAEFGGAWELNTQGKKNYKTNSKAIVLDNVYTDRSFSNILNINRKIFREPYLKVFSELEPYLIAANESNWDLTKLRYYGDGTFYEPHKDLSFVCLAISFFHKNPANFTGGELTFPEHNFTYFCNNNSMIIFPGFITHGVNKVSCNEKPFEGLSRYSMSQFLGNYPVIKNKND